MLHEDKPPQNVLASNNKHILGSTGLWGLGTTLLQSEVYPDLIEVLPQCVHSEVRMKGQQHPTGSFSHGRSLEPGRLKPKTASIALAKVHLGFS